VSDSKFCQIWLTVGNRTEADKIANALLVKHLVACVRQVPVESDFWWQGKKDHSKEILLQMESRQDLFEQIEKEVAKLHNYGTFVLESTPVRQISKSAAQWLSEELQSET
jgi:periplasmic divalent cation tolerance protein